MKVKIPLFLGIIDAHLAAMAQAKVEDKDIRPPRQPLPQPIRIYGKRYGTQAPQPILSY